MLQASTELNYPTGKKVEYKHPTEIFNFPLMFGVWAGTVTLFFAFWGIHCVLKNQETLLKMYSTKN